MADELIAFIAARLDEDEAAAMAAAHAGERRFGGRPRWSATGTLMVDADDPDDWAVADLTMFVEDDTACVHIARHDPARVLREVAADRMLIFTWESQAGYDLPDGAHEGRDPDERHADELIKWELYDVLKIRAAIWSDHPDYRAEWKP